jgi:DNA-binding NarL/FixJ family response regulator
MESSISPARCPWYANVHTVPGFFKNAPRHLEFRYVLAKSILIVDDSDMIRASLRKFLERELVFKVCGKAFDGLDALEKAPQLEPDLVILDLAMPRMNGLQAARKLRSLPMNIPIILFTMYSDALQFHDVEDAGVDAVVAKTNLVGLKQNIENLLARNEAEV